MTAETALQLRDDFLSSASHELRTPLDALKLHFEMLRRQMVADPAIQGRLQRCDRQIDRLVILARDLLDVSLISEGRLVIHASPLPLAEVLAEIVDDHRDLAAEVGCDLQTHLAPVTALVDRQRFEQIVSNLLSNALKYGAGKPVRVALAAMDREAVVTVADGGIGIAPEDVPKLFHRFGRLASARHYGGLGLGLWISRRLTEACGGRIDVLSTPGQGAAFTLHLPLAPDQK